LAEASFFPRAQPLTLGEVAALAGIALPSGAQHDAPITGAAPLDAAGPSDLAYMDNAKYVDDLAATRAGVCLVSRRFVPRVPDRAYHASCVP